MSYLSRGLVMVMIIGHGLVMIIDVLLVMLIMLESVIFKYGSQLRTHKSPEQ